MSRPVISPVLGDHPNLLENFAPTAAARGVFPELRNLLCMGLFFINGNFNRLSG